MHALLGVPDRIQNYSTANTDRPTVRYGLEEFCPFFAEMLLCVCGLGFLFFALDAHCLSNCSKMIGERASKKDGRRLEGEHIYACTLTHTQTRTQHSLPLPVSD